MADRVRIDCVTKTNRTAPHERISEVGGPNRNGGRWKLQQSQAISGVESGKWTFYVEQPAARMVDVVVASRVGKRYLKTRVDGEQPDDLLALPDCS
jgi:Protein of unknown function (DUF3892)